MHNKPSITPDLTGGKIQVLYSVCVLHVLVNAKGSGWVGEYAPAPPPNANLAARKKTTYKISNNTGGTGALTDSSEQTWQLGPSKKNLCANILFGLSNKNTVI